MDRDDKISPADMLRFLRQLGFCETHEAECEQVIRYFDNVHCGGLNYDDFLQVILPCDAPELRMVIINRENITNGLSRIDPVVEHELAVLLYKELVFQRQIE